LNPTRIATVMLLLSVCMYDYRTTEFRPAQLSYCVKPRIIPGTLLDV
jgi:hypothetical protein